MDLLIVLLVIGLFGWMYFKSSGGKFTSMKKELLFEDVLYSEFGYITALVAKLAKSDGHVSELEQEFIHNIIEDICDAFDDRESAYEYIKEIFHEEQDAQDNVYDVARRLFDVTSNERAKHEKVLEFLVNLAFIDGEFHAKEEKILEEITRALELNRSLLEGYITQFKNFYTQRKQTSSQMTLDAAFALLKIDSSSDAVMVKKAYRQQVKLHHPDIISGNGGSVEDIQNATRTLQDINQAYELIKKARGF